jgi:REP element-mobilizing transposase RayT
MSPSKQPYDFPGAWYHIIGTAYGAWLYGDPRGFRTRHHREHVEGDYKNPPPTGLHDWKKQRSKRLMKQEEVRFPSNLRSVIGTALRERLELEGIFVLCLAVAEQHVHLLVKLPLEADPRWFMGLAKKHASFELKEHQWQGKVWGKRGKELRIRNRSHQQNVYLYILRHESQGAYVWKWSAAQL